MISAFRGIPILVFALFGIANLYGQVITNFGGQRIILMPGATFQVQGGGATIHSPIAPGPSVIPGSLDPNAPTFATAHFDPPVIRAGDWSIYRLVVSAPAGQVPPPEKIPAPTGLILTSGASEQQLVTVGGQVWRVWTFNYKAAANHDGADFFLMPGYTISVNGSAVGVPPAQLQISAEDDPAARRPMELVLTGPDRKVFVGETIPIHIRASDRGGYNLQNLTKLDVFGESFLIDQNSIFTRQKKTLSNVDGVASVSIETDVLVTPLRAGELALRAVSQTTVSPLPEGMPRQLSAYRPLIESTPLVINAVSLPTNGVLPGFNGAIGLFEMETPVLSTNRFRVGEPVRLTLALRGDGNISTIPAPALPRTPHWRILPSNTEAPQPLPDGSGSVRKFNYTLIATSIEAKQTPSAPFSYFDPLRAEYIALPIEPVPVTVDPAPAGQADVAVAYPVESENAEMASDDPEESFQPPVKARGKTSNNLTPLHMRGWFLLLQLVPAGALMGLWLWDRRRRYLALHPEITAQRRALLAFRIFLADARAAADANDAAGYSAAVLKSIRVLCAPRAGANPESLICSDILDLLSESGRDGSEANLVREFFQADDERQFGRAEVRGAGLLGRRAESEALLFNLRDDLQHFVRRRVAARTSGGDSSVGRSIRSIPETAGRAAVILLAAGALTLNAAEHADLFQRGLDDFQAGRFGEASEAFRELTRREPSSGALHNLGNAEWARGRKGEAVLAWERATWLDPFNRESRANLQFARNAANLETPQLSWFEMCSAWLPTGVWTWTAFVAFWFAIAMIILPAAFRWRRSFWHQASAAVGLTIFLLTIPALAGVHTRAHRGVVTGENAPVKLSPTVNGEVLGQLPAGDTVEFGRRRGTFFHVRTASGVAGWVDASVFRPIAESPY